MTMVSSTDSIGRLITEEVLLLSDRELLQKRDQSWKQPDDPPAQANAAPISHNDKAMASVLMTLIDEQIDAAAIDPKMLSSDASTIAPRSSETGGAASRIAAHYAEDAIVYRSDVPSQPIANPLPQVDPQVFLAASSPELRMAMQAALMSAAARVGAMDHEAGRRGSATEKIGSRGSQPMLRIGAGILVVIVAAAVLAAHFG